MIWDIYPIPLSKKKSPAENKDAMRDRERTSSHPGELGLHEVKSIFRCDRKIGIGRATPKTNGTKEPNATRLPESTC